jgi:DNA invertase Pin-like site-specific DNA recombinase
MVRSSAGASVIFRSTADKLLLHILAAVAQFERELIRERVSAGMRSAKAHGTKVVRLRETGS